LNRFAFIAFALALALGSFFLGRFQSPTSSSPSGDGRGPTGEANAPALVMPVDASIDSGPPSEVAQSNVLATPSRLDLGMQPFGVQPSASLRLTTTARNR